MNNFSSNDHSMQKSISEQRSAIASLLFQVVTRVQHIDELLQWLASTIIQYFHVQVVAVWSPQACQTGQISVRLRTLASQDPSLPQYIATNKHVMEIIERVSHERHNSLLQPVEELFNHYQANLLKRYGLQYSAGYVHKSNLYLPIMRNNASPGDIPTPCTLVMFIFLQQKLSLDKLSTLSFLLEQAVVVAEHHGLLLPASTAYPQTPMTPPPGQYGVIDLIPRRHREAELLLSSNPLSRSMDISDRHARRLFAAIDGRKNIGQLCRTTGMEIGDLQSALEKLLGMRRIELCDPAGQLIDLWQFLKEH